jgi:hypothetical protein
MRQFQTIALAFIALALSCGKPASRTERGEAAVTGTPKAPVATGTATEIIDREVDAMWKKAGVTPAPDASDAEFLRRATLDIAGRIPTPGEVTHFLVDKAKDKRAKLIDRLLVSDDYAVHWGTLYADVLVGRLIRMHPKWPPSPHDWFKQAFRDGMPLDKMARELVAARGTMMENGAVGFFAGNRVRGGTIETLAGTTARFFLGLQIQCAQCHDHPTDKRWKKADFETFTAFYGAVNLRREDKKSPASTYAQDAPVGFAGRPNAKFPLRKITPRFLGQEAAPQGEETRRDVLARMLTASPLFPRAAVGRTWARLFGRGIHEPWDDLGAADDPKQPALLKSLGEHLARSGYDHRWLLKTIMLSKAYGRSSVGGKAPANAQPGTLETVFARAQVRPLTADQLFRSLLIATGIEAADDKSLDRWKVEERKQKELRQYLHAFEDDEGEEADSFTGSVPQALLLRNGDLTNGGVRAVPGAVLGRITAKSKDPAQRLEWLFITCYARPPEPAEKTQYLDYLAAAKGGERAYEDLFHAMLTSTEFVTNH